MAKTAKRWMTRNGDEVRGPFTRQMLERSLPRGDLRPTTLVSPEGDAEDWKPLSEITNMWHLGDETRADKRARADAAAGEGGSFGAGLAVDFLFGILGAVRVHALSQKHETRRGAWTGFAIHAAIGVVVYGLMRANMG